MVLVRQNYWLFVQVSSDLYFRLSISFVRCLLVDWSEIENPCLVSMGLRTSAMWNVHWNMRCSPKSNQEFLAECRYRGAVYCTDAKFDLLRLSLDVIGKTETSALVSTRNFNFEFRSVMNSRRLFAFRLSCPEDIPSVSFLQASSHSSHGWVHLPASLLVILAPSDA